MRRWRSLGARLAGLRGRAQRDAELDREIASHFEMHVEDNVRAGMTRAEALRSARIAVGGIDAMKETYRDQRGLPVIENLARDAQFGIRMLRKSFGVTLTGVLSLAVGIGANIVIFALANALFLRQPPIGDPARVVRAYEGRYSNVGWSHYESYRQQNGAFESLALFQMAPISLRTGGEAERASAMTVSANCFETLRAPIARGRWIGSREEDAPGAVLSQAGWRKRFGSDPEAVGRTIRINGNPYTIVGIAPEGFEATFAPFAPELWIPWNGPGMAAPRNDNRSGHMIGRLKPGVSPQQARADLMRVAATFERAVGQDPRPVSVYPAATLGELENFATVFVGLLSVLTGMLLLVTCVNLATLLLARGSSRTNEVATRLALGAGRSRLIVQFLTESVLVAIAGAVCGFGLATAALRLIDSAIAALPTPIPLGLGLAVDWRVAAFSAAAAMLTTLLFGLAPALRLSQLELADAFKERSASGGPGKSRLRAGLMMAQVAMSVLLLTTGGALLAGLFDARTLDRGLNVDGVLTAALDLSVRGFDPQQGARFVESALERVQAQPGVRSANIVKLVPMMLSNNTVTLMKDGQQPPLPSQWGRLESAYSNAVSGGHFRTLGIPLLAGRDFDGRDHNGKPDVAIVNETLARRLWPGESPIGKRMHAFNYDEKNPFGPWLEVVGLARDSKYVSLIEEPKPFVYRPLAQSYSAQLTLLVKMDGTPTETHRLIRGAIRDVDPEIPIQGISTLIEDTAISLLPLKIA
ncbi:MAG TPA: ABC transporter permease, partial [Bryobacteraceae bacterium]|nr:ABC transporter permease [Bryobacteraceae bacterium]